MTRFYRYFFLFIAVVFSFYDSDAQTSVTAATPVNNICVGGAYVPVGTITITEGAHGDFGSGNLQTYIISAPANFEFNTAVTPVVTEVGNGISNIVASAPLA